MSLPRIRHLEKGQDEPLWRIRPRPYPAEAFSSWILRIVAARGKLPFQVIEELAPGLQIWNRDADLLAPEILRERLAAATWVPRTSIDASCLDSHEGVLDETINGVNQSQHVRPLGTHHRTRHGYGQQYCPLCFADKKPFFRLNWRLTLFPVCTRHGAILHDACHVCDAPIIPHRGGMFACHACGAAHHDARFVTARADVIQQQYAMERVLAGGAVSHPYLSGLHPIAYFAIIHRVLATLIKTTRGGRLRSTLPSQIAPGDPDFRGQRHEARYLNPNSAHDFMAAVHYLMRGFPFMLVAACQEADVFKSWLLSDVRYRTDPYLLKSAADDYLSPGSANNRSR